MLIAMFILTALALRALYLQAWLGSSKPIRTERQGWWSWEVRRRVGMEAVPHYVSQFPVPREERIRVLRFAGIVLWHSEMSVALPNSACAYLDKVAPQDYDQQFPQWLRLTGNTHA